MKLVRSDGDSVAGSRAARVDSAASPCRDFYLRSRPGPSFEEVEVEPGGVGQLAEGAQLVGVLEQEARDLDAPARMLRHGRQRLELHHEARNLELHRAGEGVFDRLLVVPAAGGRAYPFYQDARTGIQDVYVAEVPAVGPIRRPRSNASYQRS